MNFYTVTITPTSPFGTPLDSDTLFGHICWAIYYMSGDSGKLSSFLNEFDKEPPLIMSGAFPEGYLPIPLLSPMSANEKQELKRLYLDKHTKSDSLQYVNWLKRTSRQKYIALGTLSRFNNGLNKFNLFKAILDGDLQEKYFSDANRKDLTDIEETTTDIWHNTINRISNQVIEGQLYSKTASFYPEGLRLNIYVKTASMTEKDIEEIFQFIALNGYGADKSTGYGRFDVSIKNEYIFPEPNDFNAYLLLSNTNADILSAHNALYHIQTKFGKIGGMFSANPAISPFKKPVLQLTPGSIVYSDQAVECFGKNFKNIHAKEDIQHYGIGYPVKLRLKQ